MENKNFDTQKTKNRKGLSVILKIIITLAAIGVIIIGGSLFSLLLMSEDIQIAISYIGGFVIPGLLLPVIWVKKRKKYMKFWLIAAVLFCIALGVNFGILKYTDSIEVNTSAYNENFENFVYFYPFEEGSTIVNVESKTLKLTDNLPVIDGATAVYPVCSAFVNSVYPVSNVIDDGILNNSAGSGFEYFHEWGYKYLAEKRTDIYFDVYPGKEGEAFAEPYGTTFAYTNIGTEALVFIVDKDNPIEDLTAEQVQGIYSGEITNWKEVGGKNKKIEAYQSDVGSVSQKLMERFMGDVPLMKAPTEKGYDEYYELTDKVSAYKNKANSIGFSSSYLVKDEQDIKFLSIDGVAPTKENIENGSYPFVTPFYAVTYEGNDNENVVKLIDWILSEEGQYIIRESGYFGVVSDYLD